MAEKTRALKGQRGSQGRRGWRRSGGATTGLRPSASQQAWLARGLDQPGGKLPLFDPDGRPINARTIKSCIAQGWAEPWFSNPAKPDWLVCKLTEAGRAAVEENPKPH